MMNNKLLIILVAAVFLFAGALFFNSEEEEATTHASTTKNNTVTEMAIGPVKEKGLAEAERDTYANTIKTMNARNSEILEELKKVQERQAQYEKAQLNKDDVKAIADKTTEERARSLSTSFIKKYKEIRGDFDDKLKLKNIKGIPQGLGFDNLGSGKLTPQMLAQNRKHGKAVLEESVVTVLPITTPRLGGPNKDKPVTITGEPIGGGTHTARGAVKAKEKFHKDKSRSNTKDESIPFYTINQNATLMSNATMTALVGIVPNNQGSVVDPIRFKVITGNSNIASNGLYIPGVKNIVWSGIAIGNREMSCVRGELHSVTFTFEDGTIRTINSQSDSGKDKLGGRMLGYIATPNGNPCMPGRLISNAQDYLTDRMWASGFASAADGFAQTQTTTQTTDSGAVNQFFNGDTGDFVIANTLKGTLSELVDYLRERQRQAVDLVYINGGKDVVLHVETQLNIDYDPNGRKLDHANKIPSALASYQLD